MRNRSAYPICPAAPVTATRTGVSLNCSSPGSCVALECIPAIRPRVFRMGGVGRVPSGMRIVYTHTDEAPALATRSLLPVLQAYAGAAVVEFELRDISLAGRILAQFSDRLDEEQRVADALGELGELVKT